MFVSRLLVVGAVLGCAACTAVTSVSDPNQEGMVYHLPKTLLTMTVSHIEAEDRFQIAITQTNQPDTTHRYVMSYRHNPFYSDRLCAAVSKQGLLKTVEIATDDKSPEMLLAFVKEFASRRAARRALAGVKIETVTVRFDPYLRRDVAIAERILRTKFADKSIRIQLPEITFLDSDSRYGSQRSAKKNGPETCDGRGLCFRTIVQTPVILVSDGQQVDVEYAPVADRSFMGHINLKRAFFVEKVQRLKFDEGALVGATIKHPSEGLAVANVVTSVLRAFRLRQSASSVSVEKESPGGEFDIKCNKVI